MSMASLFVSKTNVSQYSVCWDWSSHSYRRIKTHTRAATPSRAHLLQAFVSLNSLTFLHVFSSTGHMILVDEFVKLQVSEEFLALFLVVIQIGAILAVLILYFHKLNPFSPRKSATRTIRPIS